LLLKHNAVAIYDDAEALRQAAVNRHQEAVDLLLPHVPPAYCAKIVTKLKYTEADPAIIRSIEAATQQAEQEIAPEPAPALPPLTDRFNRLSADVLEETQPPSEGSIQTMRYYFSTRQQVFLKDGTPTLAVSFDDIDKGVIADRQAKLDALANPQPRSERFRPMQGPTG
jgi:hypothetical protein